MVSNCASSQRLFLQGGLVHSGFRLFLEGLLAVETGRSLLWLQFFLLPAIPPLGVSHQCHLCLVLQFHCHGNARLWMGKSFGPHMWSESHSKERFLSLFITYFITKKPLKINYYTLFLIDASNM